MVTAWAAECDGSRPAVALYEQAGWQLAGTQPATWTDPGRDHAHPQLLRAAIPGSGEGAGSAVSSY
jgi:hypothetical protein